LKGKETATLIMKATTLQRSSVTIGM